MPGGPGALSGPLDERKQVAQAAVERLARRTTQAGGELAWTPILVDAKHMKPKLKHGETPLEWFSRRDETHRTACAPLIFGQWVSEVRIWKAKLDTGHLTLVHVQAVGSGPPRVFVSPHSEPASQTRADKTACAQARVHIIEMVGAPPLVVSDTAEPWRSDIAFIYARTSLDSSLEASARLADVSGRDVESAFAGWAEAAREGRH